jgi:hypothetical protein
MKVIVELPDVGAFEFIEDLRRYIQSTLYDHDFADDKGAGYYSLRADLVDHYRRVIRKYERERVYDDIPVPIDAYQHIADSDQPRRLDNEAILFVIKRKRGSLIVTSTCNIDAVMDGFSALLREVVKLGLASPVTQAQLANSDFRRELQMNVSSEEWTRWQPILNIAQPPLSDSEDVGVTEVTKQVEAGPQTRTEDTDRSADENVFRKVGDFWEITFGGQTTHLSDIKGLSYIWHLLSTPREDVDVMELVAALENNLPGAEIGRYDEERGDSTTDMGDDYPILDDTARQDYGKRLREISQEREEAEKLGNEDKSQKLDEEVEQIRQELQAGTGLGGRKRTFRTPRQRARSSVQQAISRARDKIAGQIPALANYLELTIETGGHCCYKPSPDKQIDWKL